MPSAMSTSTGCTYGRRIKKRPTSPPARMEAIFPIQFNAAPELATGVVVGQVDGFYRGTQNLEIER